MKRAVFTFISLLFYFNSFAGIGVEAVPCYCYNVSFNTKLINFELPKYDVSEFKKVKKGAKKGNPDDMYKYAIFILTNNQHGLISIKELDKDVEKKDVSWSLLEGKRIVLALDYLRRASNHKEAQFLYYYLYIKRNLDLYIKSNVEPLFHDLQKSVDNNYEPAIELLAQLYLAGNQIEINNKKPFEDDKNYKYAQRNLLEASKLLERLPNNKRAQMELGKIYLSKEYNQYNTGVDFTEVKSLFERIGELDYFYKLVSGTDNYQYLLNYSNLFSKVDANYLKNKIFEENKAYEIIEQFESYVPILNLSNKSIEHMRFSILRNVDVIKQNRYPEYEDSVYESFKNNYHTLNEDNYWFKNLNDEYKTEIGKSYSQVNKAKYYINKFINGRYINEVKEIEASAYLKSKEIFMGMYSKEASKNYLLIFPKSPYYNDFENVIESIDREELIKQERIRQENARIKEEKERRLAYYKPQIDAYNNLAWKYVNKYSRESNPGSHSNESYEFINAENFEQSERTVKLKWYGNITIFGGNELYELTGIIHLENGSFRVINQNSAVTATNQLKDFVKSSVEFVADAFKPLPGYEPSYSSSQTTSDFQILSITDNASVRSENWTGHTYGIHVGLLYGFNDDVRNINISCVSNATGKIVKTIKDELATDHGYEVSLSSYDYPLTVNVSGTFNKKSFNVIFKVTERQRITIDLDD